MPDFVLPDAVDDLVSSTELRARGPLVVCFVRGGWCPFCSATLAAMDVVLPSVEAAGGTVVALSPDTLGHGVEMQARLGLRFKVLSDVDCGVALQFGTAYRVPGNYRDALLELGIDLRSRHGDGPGLLPMPATFVCDQAGVIRFAHVSGDITERAEPAVVSRLVEALSSAQA
jgi:peroxiredoxin